MHLRTLTLAALTTLSLAAAAAQNPGSQGTLLIVTKQAHELVMVDGSTLQVVARVPIGEDPHEVVVGPDGRTAFISNYGEGTLHTLAVVDLVKRKALPPFDLTPLAGAHGVTVHDDLLWVTVEGSKAIAALDPATRTIRGVVGTGQDKTHLVWVSRDGARMVASNAASQTFSIFNQVRMVPSMVAGAPPPPASYTWSGWHQALVPVGKAAEGFAVSPDEKEAWVGNDDGTLSIIDLATARVVRTLNPQALGANRLRFTPDGSRLLITTHTGKDLIVLDGHSGAVLQRIPIEQRGASGIQVQPDGKRAFIACPRDHFVAVVDLDRLQMVGKIDSGREPDGLAWWPR